MSGRIIISTKTNSFECVPLPKHGQPCMMCNETIYNYHTCSGGDYSMCVLCGDLCDDEKTGYMSFSRVWPTSGDYCGKCNILFRKGCLHAQEGCTDDISFGSLISSFEVDGKQYTGMPKFKAENGFTLGKVIKNITWHCMCRGRCQKMCTNAHYKAKEDYCDSGCKCVTKVLPN